VGILKWLTAKYSNGAGRIEKPLRSTASSTCFHFERPYKHAEHYLGWSEDAAMRIEDHRKGNGANLMRVVCEAGISFSVAFIKDKATRLDERKIKNRGGLRRICPICKGRKS
jgi:hypothetical protein